MQQISSKFQSFLLQTTTELLENFRHRQMPETIAIIYCTFSACGTLLGNPSSRKPLLHSGLSKFLLIILTTRSSLTNAPSSMIFFNLAPSSEPEATSALSISPVDKWQTQYRSLKRGACRR